MRSSNMNIRIDPEVKENADAIFKALGITTTDGINIFLNKVIAEGGIPFEVKVKRPNAQTVAAMEDAEKIAHDPNTKKYRNAKELFEDIDNEVQD